MPAETGTAPEMYNSHTSDQLFTDLHPGLLPQGEAGCFSHRRRRRGAVVVAVTVTVTVTVALGDEMR